MPQLKMSALPLSLSLSLSLCVVIKWKLCLAEWLKVTANCLALLSHDV